VTVKAVSAADPLRFATAAVSVVTAQAPTLSAVFPTTVAQGSLFQEVYLTGTNFLSTSTVRSNGISVPFLLLNQTLLRARFGAAQLTQAATLSVDVLPQNGMATAAFNISVVAVRPAMVGPSPDSVAQGSATLNVRFNGGYFGDPSAPAANAEFNGAPRVSDPSSTPRTLDVTLSAADFASAGLFPIAVRNPAAAVQFAATNLAVQPTSAPSVAATVAVGTSPSAVAVNQATGIAVIANRGSDSVSLLDLASNTVVNTVALPAGASPTGVTVDHATNLAYVVNNGTSTISIVDLATASVTGTITGFPAAPISMGMNPNTKLGVVAMANSSFAAIVDLTANRILSAATITTGANPQVAVETRLNWALVTPGGSGVLSIVDLGRRTTGAIAAAPAGAVRSGNIVTITTTANHNLIAGQPVFIDGVADASFNGIFTITSTPTATTFTYAQVGAGASSGDGTFAFTQALATVNLAAGVRGVGLNMETSRAFMVDSTITNGLVFSLLDQTVTNVLLEQGAVASAANPLTDMGVSVNPITDELSLIDLRAPSRLARVTVGSDPSAVAVDPGSNVAIVANQTSNNVSIVNLGSIRSLHILDVSPSAVFSGAAPVTVTVLGHGFTAASTVRLDETAITTSFISSRVLTATVPASMLASARRFALDVTDGGVSNVSGFTVIQTVAVGTAPRGVAIDEERNVAVVTNSGSGDASIVDMNSGTVTATVTVGTNPQGVDVFSRGGVAVVANTGSNSASLIDLATNTVASTATVGTEPIGLAINPDTGIAVVANSVANTVSTFAVSNSATAPAVTNITVDNRPVAVAIDYTRNEALILHTGTSNNAGILPLGSVGPSITTRVSNIQIPNGAVYDPASDRYVVAASLFNNLTVITPGSIIAQFVRVGINPTSIAYNFRTATLVTVNNASRTMTVMDFLDRRVRAVLPVSGSERFSVQIHPRTNVAVVADEANNRILLVPLPR
jgi:YVTN family beta-propeller protein